MAYYQRVQLAACCRRVAISHIRDLAARAEILWTQPFVLTGWWMMQSGANQSPAKFPDITGKYRELCDFGPVMAVQAPKYRGLVGVFLEISKPTGTGR